MASLSAEPSSLPASSTLVQPSVVEKPKDLESRSSSPTLNANPSVEKSGDLESGSTSSNNETSDGNHQTLPPNATKEKEDAINGTDPGEAEFEVWWDEPADQDPMNPMNWPESRKWSFIAVLSSITLLTLVLFFSLCLTLLCYA